MNDFDADGPSENEWEEQGELTWNEFDWEKYLREQDNAISRYLNFYEKLQGHPERIDETARLMGWEEGDWSTETESEIEAMEESAEGESASDYEGLEPYTLHKNPVFIATKAIYLGLGRQWLEIASDPAKVAQPMALAFQTALHRGEDQASLAIQALDLGDYAMAVSLFKRALRELNTSLALLDASRSGNHPAVAAFRERTLPRLFDLREIWLRVINECRDELARHNIDEEN